MRLAFARPHPEERAYSNGSAKSNGCARVSKDEDGHGIALMLRDASQRSRAGEASYSLRAAMLLSMRAQAKRRRAGEAPTCGCGKRAPAAIHCFRIVIYNERRNSDVSRRQRGP